MAKQSLTIATSDGLAPAALYTPDTGISVKAGVIFYMDIIGPRPALDDMAQHLANSGYLVLLPDLFYRSGAYGPHNAAQALADPEQRAQLFAMKDETSLSQTSQDTRAFLDALTKAGADGPVGAVGYCMGGGRALHAAATHPDRIGAVASFHGGHLATDDEDSPHRHASRISGKVYIGAAGTDASFPADQAGRLAEALRAAELDFILENYKDMRHGWAVPDHSVYDESGSQRHWDRLLAFLGDAL